MTSLTIEEIRDLVVAADRDKLCQRMSELTEDERAALAGDALELVSHIDYFWGPGTSSKEVPAAAKDLILRISQTEYPDWRSPRWTSQLLVVGLCDCEPLKYPHKYKIGWVRTDLKDMQQRMLQVLDARRPKWLAEWLKWEWKQEFPVPSWYLERGLIRSGALPLNETPEYYARMADDMQVIECSYLDTCDTVRLFPSRRAMLEADPELFQHDIWKLLQVDSSAFRYPQLGWPELLIELCESGQLERPRLLADGLSGMTLPLSVKTLAGLAKFHEQLKPTIDEREQLIESYLRLLHVSNSTVVGLAIAALEKLQKAKRLPAEAFLKNLPGVFLAEKKTPALTGIKLVEKVVQAHPAQISLAIPALLAGLQHMDADVQSDALDGLSKLRSELTDQSRDQIEYQLDFLAIAVRPRAKMLLDELTASSPKEASAQSSTESGLEPASKTLASETAKAQATKSAQAVQQSVPLPDVTQIDPVIRRDSHLDSALTALSQAATPTVHPVAKHVIPRRDRAYEVVPIRDLDELIASVSSFIENVDDVMEVERILDGIVRLHREKPSDFDKRVGALRKQVIKRSAMYSGSILDVGANIGLTDLLTTWLDMEPIVNVRPTYWFTMRQWFLRERLYELTERILVTKRGDAYHLSKQPTPMLALPTHRGGWLDPVALVERINQYYAPQRVLLDERDLAQAILRMTPDGRREALNRLGEPDYYNGGHLLRYALGEVADEKHMAGKNIARVAAERARMISLAAEGYQPVIPIAHATLGSGQRILLEGALQQDPTVPFELLEKGFSIEPTTDYVHDHLARHTWLQRWEAMTNPIDTDASCLAGQTSHLLDSEATWTSATCRLAVLAASHDRGEIRILATDALIEAGHRLLVIPEVLGHALASHYALIKLNRISKVLADVANVSKLHHWLVFRCLESCVLEMPEMPSEAHLIFSQMLDSAIAIGAAPQPKTCDKLKSSVGKSKSGKLASQLLERTTDKEFVDSINTAMVESILARAQRWQSRMHCSTDC